MECEQIRAGDSAFHMPSGETWYVLGVNSARGLLCAAGWPPTIANLTDCSLVERGNGLDSDDLALRRKNFGLGWDGDGIF